MKEIKILACQSTTWLCCSDLLHIASQKAQMSLSSASICRWDEFFAACKDCHFDFLATHLYTCNPSALQWFLNECKKYGLPIWLTEFSCPGGSDGTVQQQQVYMEAALHILHGMPEVQRYAWFAPRTSGDWLGSSPSLLQLGKAALSGLGRLYMQNSAAVQIGSDWHTANTERVWTSMCGHCPSSSSHLGSPDFNMTCADCGFCAHKPSGRHDDYA